MGTEVLRSNDCLKNTMHLNYYGSRPPPSTPPPMNSSKKKPLRSPPPEPSRKKQFRSGLPRSRSVHKPEPETRKALVMEEVKILKRGEPAKPAAAAADNVDRIERSRSVGDPGKENSKPKSEGSGSGSAKASAVSRRYDTATALCSTNRIGPNPEIVPRFSDLNLNLVYAGPSVVISPSPSSVPIPTLSLRSRPPSCSVGTGLNVAATKEIMCLLRLDV